MFFWGYLKNIVYQKQPTTPDDSANKDDLSKYSSHDLCKQKEPSQNEIMY